MSITTMINKAQAVLEMYKDGEIEAEKAIISLTKHINEMAKKGSKKVEGDSDGEVKEKVKRKPNDFILFSKRVRSTLKENEEAFKEVGTHNQFCSYLKSIKPYAEWTDDEAILSAKKVWVKPEVSKQTAEGKSKSSNSSVGKPEKAVEKAEKPKKGKKTVEKTVEKVIEAPIEKAKVIEAPIEKAKVIEVPVKKAGRPKKTVEKAEMIEVPVKKAGRPKKVVEEEKEELDFDGFEHDGTLYLKSKEGYVLTVDTEWVGIFDGENIDEDADEPAIVKKWCEENK